MFSMISRSCKSILVVSLSMILLLTSIIYGSQNVYSSSQKDEFYQRVMVDEIVVEDGVTQPVFSYEDAIREVVQVQSPVNSHDGYEPDILTVDIIRPAESDKGLRVPTIIIPSPYYFGPGRGRQGETKPDPGATPHIVVGDRRFSGNLLTGQLPVTGQTGPLVNCGLAQSQDDCPADTEGAIAIIERGRDDTLVDQILNVASAGAIGVVVYNNDDGSFTASIEGGVPIPALGISRADGLELLDGLEGKEVNATLRELVNPIDFFPLFYDNFFVPRGYAVALVDMAGSRASTGCLDVGGPAEIDGTAAVVEWLAGEGYAVDGKTGVEVTADWSNGKSAMIGKSWDGSVPYGVAARAPEGLTTIVSLAGLSHWQSDFWTNGVRYGGSTTLWHDRHSDNPSMDNYCSETRAHLLANEENPDPDTDFWQERNYVKDVGNFEASVFLVYGKNDYNVKPVNFGRMWEALAEHNVQRKMWLSQVAHEEPFDFRREKWINTIHRWFDYWLHDIDNGIMDEPMVEVEHDPGEWTSFDNWPNGSTNTHLWLGTTRGDDDQPQGALWSNERYVNTGTVSFKEVRQNINTLARGPFSARDNRLIFLSPVLSKPVHVSGEVTVTLDARIDGANATFSALLVDYGTDERIQHETGGLITHDTETCFGQGTAADTGCYFDVGLRTHTADYEVVTRGWVNTAFHTGEEVLDPDETYRVTWGLQHHDYVFKPGHRIGIVIAGPETHLHRDRHPTTNNTIEVLLGSSRVQLPVVGGTDALREALEPSASGMKTVIGRFAEERAFENEGIVRSLMVHLTAVSRYEEKELAEKVVKHMESFKMLLEYQKENELISDEAYHVLQYDADTLIAKWKHSIVVNL